MSERIYAWLLKLYPRGFRQEYGEAMTQVFRDRLRAENAVRLWLDVAGDLAVSVPREHRRPRTTAPAPPGTYRFSDEAVKKMSARGHFGSTGWLMASLAIGLAAGLAGNAPRWPIIIIYAIFALLLVPMAIRGRFHMRDHWRGYELILKPDRISFKLRGEAHTTLLRSEIVRVLEEPGGTGLAIEGSDGQEAIWAPSLLTGYAELREQLAGWMPITQWKMAPAPHRFLRLLGPGRVLPFACFPATMLARSSFVVLPMAAICGLWLLFALYGVFRSESPLALRLGFLAVFALLVGKVALNLT